MSRGTPSCRDLSRQSAIFRSILSSIREAVVTLDLDFRITFFSPRARELTGWEPAEVLGRPCREVLGTGSCGSEACPGRRCLSHGDETISEDHVRCREGSLCPVTRRTVPLLDDDSREPVGVLVILEDRRAFRVDDHEPQGFLGIVGGSDPMRRMFGQLRLFAPYEETVLIQGESGTGKELVARALHTLSPRSAGPFVAVNCAALPEDLLESEFFGHVRGAFTGAVRDRVGAVEKAAGGTLFLDEIGELAVGLQAKLLRFLQERRYSRVGEHDERHGAARILAATNRNLEERIALGRFREDLFFRLNVLPLPVPPLRDRPTDIPLLVDHFLRDAAGPGQTPKRAPRDLMELFLRHPWPGNVRELQNTVKYLAILSPGAQLQAGYLPASFRSALRDPVTGRDRLENQAPSASLGEEKSRILLALREAGGNRARAAAALGMHRTTLYRRMAVLGVTPFSARDVGA